MAKKKNKEEVAYQNASDILSGSVNYFRVFPDYFLELVKTSNGHLYKILEGNTFMEKVDSKTFEKMLFEQLKAYLDNIKVLESKSDYIANWKTYEDKLSFLQYVMDQIKLRKRIEGFDLEEFKEIDKKVNEKEITGDEAVNNFGIGDEELLEYERNMKNTFESGD